MPRAHVLPAVALALLVLVGATPVDAASLQTESAILPAELVGAAAAYLDGKVFVIGGRTESGAYSDKIYAYDVGAGSLREIGTLPQPPGGATVGGTAGRYSGTAVAAGGKIYHFGGAVMVQAYLNADDEPENVPKASRDIIEIDPTTGSARILDDRLPTGAWGLTGVESDGYVYLFGGFTFDPADLAATGRHDRVLRFQPGLAEGSAQRVKLLQTSLPYAVQDAAVAKLGPRIYVMGGLSDHHPNSNPCPTYTYYNAQSGQEETEQTTVCLTKRIVSFDPTPDSELAIGVAGELPYRSQFVSAGVVGGKAYIPGGLLTDGSASTSIIEVSVNNAGTPTPRVIVPTLPTGAYGQAVTSTGTNLFIIGGRSGNEDDLSQSIVRLDPRVTPPWAPRAATAIDITGGVRLTWEPPTYTGDGAITGYRIYRQASGAAEERLAEVTTLAYEDKSLRPGTEYVWRIAAVNAAGESNASARVSRSSGVAVPSAVEDLQGFPGNELVVLRWRAPLENGGSNITGYRVYRNDERLDPPLPPTATEYTDETAENGEPYVYVVRAFNSKGEGAAGQSVRVTPAPVPPAPAAVNVEVIATGATDNAVRLSWFAPSEVERYVVYRSALPGRAGAPIAEVTATTFIDNEVERGRTYYYSVAAENDAGASPPSTEAAVSLVRKPGAPGDVAALGMEGEILVEWSAPADTGDAPPSALRYYVSRSGGGSSRSIIVKTDIEGTRFVDRAVTPGQEYTYTVTTLNPMASDASASASATARTILNRAPSAVLAILPPVTTAGAPVELDASQSTDIDGTIKSYLFDFGDGTDPVQTNQATISHSYATNGTFAATVIVTDNRNQVSEPARAQVMVGEVITERPDSGIPGGIGGGVAPGAEVKPPGSETPGPGALLVLLAVALVALALRHRTK